MPRTPSSLILILFAGYAVSPFAVSQDTPQGIQVPTPPPPPANPKILPGDPTAKARLSGQVLTNAGQPVGRAIVRLQAPAVSQSGQPTARTYNVTTDDAGRFVFENVEPSRNYQLTAQRPGFLLGRYGAKSPSGPGVPFALESGQSTIDVAITMIPQGAVAGRVTDVNGDPIPGATVTMLRRGYARSFRQLTLAGANNTNDLGQFRIANLPPGRYYMAVTDRRVAGTTGNNASITTYYPNGTDPQSAVPLDLTAGQDLQGMEVRMRQARVFTISGKAVDTSGAGLGNVPLLWAPQGDLAASTILNPLTRVQIQTRTDGTFELPGVSPGLYGLQTSPVQVGGMRGLGRIEVNVADSDVDDLELVIAPGQTITGTLALEGGDVKELPLGGPGGNTASNLVQVLGRVSVVLNDTSPLPLNPTASGVVKSDGTFLLENVARGRFQLTVAPIPPGVYLKSARFGGVDITHSEIDLTSGGGAGIDVVLSKNAADVSGTILSLTNQLTASMPVALWTAEPEPGTVNDGVLVGMTNETGGFRFQNLRPGTYYIAAWEDVDVGLMQYREYLVLLQGEATRLDVAEGEHKATQVRIIPEERSRDAEARLQ